MNGICESTYNETSGTDPNEHQDLKIQPGIRHYAARGGNPNHIKPVSEVVE